MTDVVRGIDLPLGPSPTRPSTVELGGSDLAAVRALAGAHGCGLEDLVFGVWVLALSRYLDGKDAVLAVSWRGRHDIGVPLPLPVDAAGLVDAVTAGLGGAWHRTDPAPGFSAVAFETSPGPLGPADAVLRCETGAERVVLTVAARTGATSQLLLLESVVEILTSLAARGDVRLAGGRERDLFLRWSGVDVPAEERTVADLLLDAFARHRDEVAVTAPDGELTFAELGARAAALARHLGGLGIGREDRVVVLAGRSRSTVVAFAGVLLAGAVYVPVDPAHPERRLRELVAAVRPEALLGGVADERLLGSLGAGVMVVVERVGESPAAPLPEVRPADAAYAIFTSGTTGTPRPVVVEHRSAVRLQRELARTVYPPDGTKRLVFVSSFGFDASLIPLLQLAAGHTTCVVSAETMRDGVGLLDHLRRERVDILMCTPSYLRAWLTLPGTLTALPPHLFVMAEDVDSALWRSVAGLDGVRAVNLYGPTECTVVATAARITGGTPSIGRPLDGLRAWVLDDALRPVPPGGRGELCLSGVQVSRGYGGDDEATARRFVTTVLPDGTVARVYRTGDLVRFLDDGSIHYAGRLDEQVKIRGFRVEPGEVEEVLHQHPAVVQAVVVCHVGRGAVTRLDAYVVLRDGVRLGGGDLRAWLAERLPDHAVPNTVVLLEELPLRPSGKVDRTALPAPGPVSATAEPGSPVERILLEVWRAVLGRDDIGVTDGFVELGGDSIAAMRVRAAAADLGVNVPLRVLFKYGSIRLIATRL